MRFPIRSSGSSPFRSGTAEGIARSSIVLPALLAQVGVVPHYLSILAAEVGRLPSSARSTYTFVQDLSNGGPPMNRTTLMLLGCALIVPSFAAAQSNAEAIERALLPSRGEPPKAPPSSHGTPIKPGRRSRKGRTLGFATTAPVSRVRRRLRCNAPARQIYPGSLRIGASMRRAQLGKSEASWSRQPRRTAPGSMPSTAPCSSA